MDNLPTFSKRRPQLQVAIKPYSSPLFYAEEVAPNTLSTTGGTALFLQTEHGRFLVTAAHVWKEMQKLSAQPGGRFTIAVSSGSHLISLRDAEVVDQDEILDLTILRSPRITEAILQGNQFYQPLRLPPPPLIAGEIVGFIGFPGQLREIKGLHISPLSWYLEHPCYPGIGDKFMIPGFGEERQLVNHVEQAPAVDDVGGSSGAPVFAYRDGRVELVGVVTEGTTGANPSSTFQISSIRRLKADGTLEK